MGQLITVRGDLQAILRDARQVHREPAGLLLFDDFETGLSVGARFGAVPGACASVAALVREMSELSRDMVIILRFVRILVMSQSTGSLDLDGDLLGLRFLAFGSVTVRTPFS